MEEISEPTKVVRIHQKKYDDLSYNCKAGQIMLLNDIVLDILNFINKRKDGYCLCATPKCRVKQCTLTKKACVLLELEREH